MVCVFGNIVLISFLVAILVVKISKLFLKIKIDKNLKIGNLQLKTCYHSPNCHHFVVQLFKVETITPIN